jgi:hypothetical protein
VKKSSPQNRIYVVHRLDRETSGILVFAKNREAQLILQENWHQIVTKRVYVALVEGKVEKEQKATGGGDTSVINGLIEYQGNGVFRPLNKKLRSGNEGELSEIENNVKNSLDKGMTGMENKEYLYRGIGNSLGDEITKAGPGGIIKDDGFISTSRNSAIAFNPIYGRGWKATIIAPKGTKSIDVNKTMGKKSVYKEEKEVILERGSRLGIMKVNKNTKTVNLIVLKKGQSVTDGIMDLE